MLNSILQHKVTAAIVMIVLLAAAWYGLTQTAAPPPILQSDSSASGDEDLVATLLALRAVSLSGTIFTDPVFMSLQDFGVEIQPEPVGRPNPFLPLSQNVQVLQTQQSIRSAQIFAQPTKK